MSTFLGADLFAFSERLLAFVGREALLSTVVFVVAALVWWMGGRRSAVVAYGLWGLVFLRLILPPDLSHPWSAGALAQRLMPPEAPSAHTAAHTGVATADVPLVSVNEVPVAEISAVSPVTAEKAESKVASSLAAAGNWLKVVLATLYVKGLLLWLGWMAFRLYEVRRVVRKAAPLTSGPAFDQVEAWRQRLGIRRRVALRVTGQRLSPFTVGTLRPVVVLPSAILKDSTVTEAAVAHELAHVARWDVLQLRLQQLVQGVYFFHPVAHLAGRGLVEERERLCDAMVLAQGTLSPREYAHSLVTVLKLEPPVLAAPHLINRQRRLTMRLRTILSTHDGRRRPASLLAVAALAAFILPLASDAVPQDAPPAPKAPVAPTAVSPPAPPVPVVPALAPPAPALAPAVAEPPPVPRTEPVLAPAVVEPPMPPQVEPALAPAAPPMPPQTEPAGAPTAAEPKAKPKNKEKAKPQEKAQPKSKEKAKPQEKAQPKYKEKVKTKEKAKPVEAPMALINPLPDAKVTSHYGETMNPFTKKKDFHKGIDLGAPMETPILAAAAGTVEIATTEYENPNAGTVVIVDHGQGWKTYYGHLGDLKVKPGQKVTQAQPLAGVGSSGLSTGPHLHFEIWNQEERVDPASVIADWR